MTTSPTEPPESTLAAREKMARAIVRDRLNHYGIDDEQIASESLMEPVDHAAHGCAPMNPEWDCFNEWDSPNHPRHDWADEAAEWVCWVIDHPSIAARIARLEADLAAALAKLAAARLALAAVRDVRLEGHGLSNLEAGSTQPAP